MMADCRRQNFTAFASPFIGVRSPVKRWANELFNVLGAHTLCMSGRQLFGIDQFRDTGKPLLALLADPKSIFMSGLARFKRHTLYCNVTNDRSAVYYTTGITKTDPYTDMSKVKANYVPGYEDVILDPINPLSPEPPAKKRETLPSRIRKWIRNMPFVMALTFFIPVGIVAFLINSGVQTVRSLRRVRKHELGLAGIDITKYRVPLWINEIRGAVEDAYETINSSQQQDYLSLSSDELDGKLASNEEEAAEQEIMALERKQSHATQPTLALAPYQFAAIQSLDKLGWRKYPVWIHKVRHSHAAIIMRRDNESHDEGWTVLRHWLNEEFLV